MGDDAQNLQTVLVRMNQTVNPLKGKEAVEELFKAGGIEGLAEHIHAVKGLETDEAIKALIEKKGGIDALKTFKSKKTEAAQERQKKEKKSSINSTDDTNIKKIEKAIKNIETIQYINTIKNDKNIPIEDVINRLIEINGKEALEYYTQMQTKIKVLLDEEWAGSDIETAYAAYEQLRTITEETNVDTIERLKKEIAGELEKVNAVDTEFVDKFLEKTQSAEPSVASSATSSSASEAPPDAPDNPPEPPDAPPAPDFNGPPAPPGPPGAPPNPPPGPSKGPSSSPSGNAATKRSQSTLAEQLAAKAKNLSGAAAALSTFESKGDLQGELNARLMSQSRSSTDNKPQKKDNRTEAQQKRDEEEEKDRKEEEEDAAAEAVYKKASAESWDDTSEDDTLAREREQRAIKRTQNRQARTVAKEKESAEAREQSQALAKKREVEQKEIKDRQALDAAKSKIRDLHQSNKESIEKIKQAKSYMKEPRLIAQQQDLKKAQDETIAALRAQKKKIEASVEQNKETQAFLEGYIETLETPEETPEAASADMSAGAPDSPEPPGPPDAPPEPPAPPGAPPAPIFNASTSFAGVVTKPVAKQSSNNSTPPVVSNPNIALMAQERALEMSIKADLALIIGSSSSSSLTLKEKLGAEAVNKMMNAIIDAAISRLEKNNGVLNANMLTRQKAMATNLEEAVAESNILDQDVKTGINIFYKDLSYEKKQALREFYTESKLNAETEVARKDTKNSENHTAQKKAERKDQLKDLGLEDLEPTGAVNTNTTALANTIADAINATKASAQILDADFTTRLTEEQTKAAEKFEQAMTKLEENKPAPKVGVALQESFIEIREQARAKVKQSIETIKQTKDAAVSPKPVAEPQAAPVVSKVEDPKPTTTSAPKLESAEQPHTEPKPKPLVTTAFENTEEPKESPIDKKPESNSQGVYFSESAKTADKAVLTQPDGSSLGQKTVVTPEAWIKIKSGVEALAEQNKNTIAKSDGDNKITVVEPKIDIVNKGTEVTVSSRSKEASDAAIETLVAHYKATAQHLEKTDCAINTSPNALATAKLIIALCIEPTIQPIMKPSVEATLRHEAGKAGPNQAKLKEALEKYDALKEKRTAARKPQAG